MSDTGSNNELALDSDDSLPWLESDEYDPDEGAVDTSRIVMFAGVLLLLLVAGIGGVWWYSNYLHGEQVVADGSTIKASEGPYKERPADPGGKEFAGTGNVAPGVGEGVSAETQLADVETSTPIAAPTTAPRPTITAHPGGGSAAADSGVAVQVGAYGSRAKAESGWATLRGQTTLLNGVRYRIVQGQADIGTVYRLQALPGDLATARTLCNGLKTDGIACNIKQ
ncbi:MAG: SPOR domain-containing protein [Altererythrobacter sp.]|nr:SPOR domain-containing protein [Altererythrobacter sp.]